MCYAEIIKSKQSETGILKSKLPLLTFIFILLFQSSGYSQNPGNCLWMTNNGNYEYAKGTGISATFTALTVEAWVNQKSVQGDPTTQRFVSVGSDAAVLRHDNSSGSLTFYLKYGDNYLPTVSVSGILRNEKWYHIAGTWAELR